MKRITAIIAALAAVVLAVFLISDARTAKGETLDFFSMNTYMHAEIEGRNAKENLNEIKSIIEKLDYSLLSRKSNNSFVYQLNKNGEASLTKELTEYFLLMINVSQSSNGAFDFTLGSVSDLWSFGNNPSIPDKNVLADTLSHSGYEKIAIKDGKIILGDKSAVIDLGASGKGIALDSAKKYLETQDIEKAIINAGGSVLLYGDDTFTVGIRNPYGNATSTVAEITLNGGCISTSGCYERYFEENGTLYHHILDPKTGYPVQNNLLSVTVICESGILSDVLSTACYVLGIEKGSALAEKYGATAIFITKENEIHIGTLSENSIRLMDNDFVIRSDG